MIHQVAVGSCTNSSLKEMLTAASVLDGKTIPEGISLVVSPGTRQVYETLARDGGLAKIVGSGARIMESACGACIGMGQAPGTGQVSLRTFPRNFPGRSGTKDDQVYLCSPETAAAAALKGVITDPRDLGKEMDYPRIKHPAQYIIDKSSIIFP